jgi:hypothetical protein
VTVFENRVLRKIVGPKEQSVSGGSRNCFMRNFTIFMSTEYYYGGQLARMRWAGYVVRIGGNKNAFRYVIDYNT